jgi:atypical dual specificity phosphatase
VSYLNFSWVLLGSLAGAQGPTSRRDLIFFRRNDIRAIVRMDENTISGEVLDLVDLYEPVPDFTAPTIEQMDRMIKFIQEQIETWERPVVVTCHAGLGRTGTVLACYMASVGYPAQDAIDYVREMRPDSIQTPEQEQVVHQYAQIVAATTIERTRRAWERFRQS